ATGDWFLRLATGDWFLRLRLPTGSSDWLLATGSSVLVGVCSAPKGGAYADLLVDRARADCALVFDRGGAGRRLGDRQRLEGNRRRQPQDGRVFGDRFRLRARPGGQREPA